MLYDNTSSSASQTDQQRLSSIKNTTTSKQESISARVENIRQPETVVKQIGGNKVVLRQLQPTKVVSNDKKPASRNLQMKQNKSQDKTFESFNTSNDHSRHTRDQNRNVSRPVGGVKNDDVLEDLEEILDEPESKPKQDEKSKPEPKKAEKAKKDASKPYQIDFNSMKKVKPQAEEIPSQNVMKIEFNAVPLKKPGVEEHERSLSEPAESRSHSIESRKSENVPNTPPFSIRNLDLDYTQGKYKNVIPNLDFTKLGRRKKKDKGKEKDKQVAKEKPKDKKPKKPPTPVSYIEVESEEEEYETESDQKQDDDKMFKPAKKIKGIIQITKYRKEKARKETQ